MMNYGKAKGKPAKAAKAAKVMPMAMSKPPKKSK
jgi:hypothetical protein